MTLIASLTSMTMALFLMFTHPLILVILLISFTLTVMSSLFLFFNCTWLAMLMFLIFLGGLLIIFAYLSALVPNEMKKNHALWLSVCLSPLLLNQLATPVNQPNMSKPFMQLNFLYEMSFILFLLLYLLMALVTSLVMSQNLKTPLHQESY